MQTDAIVFTELNKAVLMKIDMPELRPEDAIVEVEMSGVSVGTEVWALTGQRPPGDTTFPCVPGYQAVGVVRATGPECVLKPGERIFFTKTRLAPPQSQGNWMGSHVRYAVVDGAENPSHGYWTRLPDEVSSEEAVLSALAAVSERGLNHIGVNPGDFCVVIGQGVIGQTAAQVARIKGATVLAADISTERLELSKKYSADIIVNPNETDLAAEIRKHRPDGADLVVEASGNKALIPLAIDLIRPLGRVLLQGWYPGDVAFNFHEAHNRRPTIAVTCGLDGDCNRHVIEWIAEGKLKIAPLLTHVFQPEEAPKAYEMMRTKQTDFLGVAFRWSK